ncbi:MAG: hypothetical protein WA902_16045 [Thermosynechococcaceae cyanobacterium]
MTEKESQTLIPEHLPFLKAICWQTDNVHRLTPEEMLSRYERGWRYRTLFNNLEGEELAFLKTLAQQYQSWLQPDL